MTVLPVPVLPRGDVDALRDAVQMDLDALVLAPAQVVTSGGGTSGPVDGANIITGTVTGDKMAVGTLTATQIAAGSISADRITSHAITAAQIAANTITATEIQAGTLTATEIQAASLTADRLVAHTLTANEISAGTITATEIAGATITGGLIAASTITATNIASGTITSGLLAADSVTSTQIVSGAVTSSKISVSNLQAVSADMGVLGAGRIDLVGTAGRMALGKGITPSVGGAFDGILGADTGGNVTFKIDAATGDVMLKGNIITGSSGLGNISGQIDGTTNIVTASVNGDRLIAHTITATEIAASTITSVEILANTITAGQIASGTITATQIAAGTITGTEISATAIDGKTVTGAIVRTAGSGARVEMNGTSNALSIYDASSEVVHMDGSSGMAIKPPQVLNATTYNVKYSLTWQDPITTGTDMSWLEGRALKSGTTVYTYRNITELGAQAQAVNSTFGVVQLVAKGEPANPLAGSSVYLDRQPGIGSAVELNAAGAGLSPLSCQLRLSAASDLGGITYVKVTVGTDTRLIYDDQKRSDWVQTMNEQGLAIIRGAINGAGSATNGAGFTVTKNGTGDYTINFSSPSYNQTPVAVATCELGNLGDTAHVFGISTSSVRLKTCNASGTQTDCAFEFIVIGKR